MVVIRGADGIDRGESWCSIDEVGTDRGESWCSIDAVGTDRGDP